MDDVCEFRKLLELECARLAMDRATDREFQELEQICSDYEALKKNTITPVTEERLKELTHYDVDFHEKICLMAHNTLYRYCFSMARSTIEKYISLNLQKRISTWEERGVSVFEGDYRHRSILNAIRNHDFAQCKKLYDDMIDFKIVL